MNSNQSAQIWFIARNLGELATKLLLTIFVEPERTGTKRVTGKLKLSSVPTCKKLKFLAYMF